MLECPRDGDVDPVVSGSFVRGFDRVDQCGCGQPKLHGHWLYSMAVCTCVLLGEGAMGVANLSTENEDKLNVSEGHSNVHDTLRFARSQDSRNQAHGCSRQPHWPVLTSWVESATMGVGCLHHN
ncbi:hypothetical protein AAFF_G00213330 [Aldrovandia affinis]|uniref:Uncharacterized protein n=1 Tax=Aldrovandia affinis TaxID=143900 RepID=A0AAD7RGU4_9TELE|nr:hypothetical protein AAFF_G00213330 [Aldrovandia affinis]